MDTAAHWPQDVVMKPMAEIVATTTCLKPSLEKRASRPQKEEALNCPRCHSTNTKFCYYNNYSLTQPRYFCKTCRRYWTEGGTLRNIPVGGGSRKNKRSSPQSSSSTSGLSKINLPVPDVLPSTDSQPSHQNPKSLEGKDFGLSFPSGTHHQHDFKAITELIKAPNSDFNDKNILQFMPPPSTSGSAQFSSALELLNGITSGGLMNTFLAMPSISDVNSNTVFSSSGFCIPEYKPSLNFSFHGLGNSHDSTTAFGDLEKEQKRFLFPFQDFKQTTSTTANSNQNGIQNGSCSAGFWNNGNSW